MAVATRPARGQGEADAVEQHLPALVEDRIATRIFAKDHTLWGPDAEAESSIRLGWVEAAVA